MSSFMPGAINSETFQIGAYSVVVKKRLAEGGFGFVDLVSEHRSGKDLCVSNVAQYHCVHIYMFKNIMQ